MAAQKKSKLNVLLVDDIFSVRNARVVSLDELGEGKYDLRLVERGISTYYCVESKKDIGEKLRDNEGKPDCKAYVTRR